jgi:hypothetical protein
MHHSPASPCDLPTHPSPADGDLALIAVDNQSRRIRPVRGRHIRGYEPIRPGASAPFESLLERSVIRGLAQHRSLLDLVAQPMTVRYRYCGKPRAYTPDLLVVLSDVPPKLAAHGFGLRTIVEVRATGLLEFDHGRTVLGWRALRLAVEDPIVMITDQHVAAGLLEVTHA